MLRSAYGIEAKPTMSYSKLIGPSFSPGVNPNIIWHPCLEGASVMLNLRNNINFCALFVRVKDGITEDEWTEWYNNPDYCRKNYNSNSDIVFVCDLSSYFRDDEELSNDISFRFSLSDGPNANHESFILTSDKKFWRVHGVSSTATPRIYSRGRIYSISTENLYLKKNLKSIQYNFISKNKEVELCCVIQ